ncbi:MAG: 2-C-methyl-D-erythritol 2,4-cyclodiphosphate synthase [Deltaproteobacteria bacterium RIFCSPLOWO2_12_FULL_60_19]|nr:MAG: 2-C-methyl-D-erythritol 2,4-cyclodiphosphate synthase [Deltaproteobacteria bacterium RIFCSPLOWO2_12_FULL_60_19]
MTPDFRIGHGFDVHRFQRGRKLLLGGVRVPFTFGLAGHSDADVVLHALINAILGAMGERDIGAHFPDTDRRLRGISSAKMLDDVLRMMKRKRFRLVNGDITVMAQKPRLAPSIPAIRRRMADLLKVDTDRINLKAVTTEGLGWIGKGQGMAAAAVVLLEKRKNR